ncbi:MAG: DUF4160 domain-containing protein [Terracidiphilus sp.]|jgi:hypothetical protein
MPTISRFYGILIQMYFGDHVPPHFHALYAEFEALIDIRTFEIIRGELPSRAIALVLEWAQQHREELTALKGHDFSRAANGSKTNAGLWPLRYALCRLG